MRRSKARARLACDSLTLLAFALLNLTSLAPIGSVPLGESVIKVTRFQVPAQVRAGEQRRLTCLYELHGATLHAMKLFKDDKEFYRFTPGDAKLTFPVAGVFVDQNRSNDREVWLKINKRSAGQYKCQVSIEGTFNSVSAERRMEVLETGSPASGGGAGHLAGASVWHQHLVSQQQPQQQQQQHEPGGRANTRSRASQAAIQQHSSQLYGIPERSGSVSRLRGDGTSATALLLFWPLLAQVWMRRIGWPPPSPP